MSEGRILVVEDDFDISNMLLLYFKSLGYEVYHAPRGGDALEMTRQKCCPILTATKFAGSCEPTFAPATSLSFS
jgi:CheY-like chemotaxis protein